MENKTLKTKVKNAANYASVRIKTSSKKTATALLNEANNKKYGRKIKFEELVEVALTLINKDHLKQLQERSFSNEDRKELLRQKYIEKHGQITKDDFTGFMMTAEFQGFLSSIYSFQSVAS